MPALPAKTLWSKVNAVLPRETVMLSKQDEVHPSVVDIPDLETFRIYVWTLTQDRSKQGRPLGVFKIQLILPGQGAGERGSLDLDSMPTALLGYSADFGVFVGWEARLYTDFGYSANVQVRDDLLVEARDSGWAVAPPRTAQGQDEVRVAFRPAHLQRFLTASAEADRIGQEGTAREAYFLSRVPKVAIDDAPSEPNALVAYIESARRMISVKRAVRSSSFAQHVKLEFDYACAVCLTQINIVEAAHIVPVSEGGPDEVWNGIALCPNHHRLFDSRLLLIDPELVVRVDQTIVEFLTESGKGSGIEILQSHDGHGLRKPSFWNADNALRTCMCDALRTIFYQSGIS